MTITIDIISDTVCPWCLIGKRRLEQALDQRPELAVTLRWRPFQLHPDMPPEGMDRQTAIAAKFGSLERARELYQRIATTGRELAIPFDFDAIPRTPNTINSHRLIRWAGELGAAQQNTLVEALFRRFFIDGEDIGDNQILIAAAAEAGLDAKRIADRLLTDQDIQETLAEEAEARQLGVQGVPFFIVDGQLGISGAQPPEVFLNAFEQLNKSLATE